MDRIKIAVDVDDSLIDTLGSLIEFHNETYGTTLKESDFTSCWFREVWGGTKEEEDVKLEKFYKSHYHSNIVPVANSKEILELLFKEGVAFSAVTGRKYSLKSQTRNCIKQHYRNIFTEVYLTNSYGMTGLKIKKSSVCKKIKADAIIDDDMNHVLDCVNAGIPVFVFDRPWNQGELPIGATRMMSWTDLPYLISTL